MRVFFWNTYVSLKKRRSFLPCFSWSGMPNHILQHTLLQSSPSVWESLDKACALLQSMWYQLPLITLQSSSQAFKDTGGTKISCVAEQIRVRVPSHLTGIGRVRWDAVIPVTAGESSLVGLIHRDPVPLRDEPLATPTMVVLKEWCVSHPRYRPLQSKGNT